MIKLLLIALHTLAFVSHCQPRAQDQELPENTVNLLFESARQQNSSGFKNLCHPDADNDGDVQRICDLNPESPDYAFTMRCLATGRITGPTRYHREKSKLVAGVPISFDTRVCRSDRLREETMDLIQIEERWYLLGF